ncbi:hypothetical protein ACI4B7_28505, partial [Klebsiella pneumoniae]|uniref:hypothetical protein n=1 Tax=Klebsiella pneumoniae TaxID=573 RepID=UPI0038546A42
MQEQASSDQAFEWLDHVRPVGLVLARSLLKSLGLQPERQGKSDEDIATSLLEADESKPALKDPWTFF